MIELIKAYLKEKAQKIRNLKEIGFRRIVIEPIKEDWKDSKWLTIWEFTSRLLITFIIFSAIKYVIMDTQYCELDIPAEQSYGVIWEQAQKWNEYAEYVNNNPYATQELAGKHLNLTCKTDIKTWNNERS